MKRVALERRTPLKRSSRAAHTDPGVRQGKRVSPASKAQREKARQEPCVVTGAEALYGAVIDPAHLCARAKGGCDDPLCVVPLERHFHRSFDDGDLDLLPHLVGKRVPELQHALGHYDGNVVGLLQRLTGKRWEAA